MQTFKSNPRFGIKLKRIQLCPKISRYQIKSSNMSVYSQEKYCPQGIMSETLKRKKKKENQKLPGGTELLIGSRRWIVQCPKWEKQSHIRQSHLRQSHLRQSHLRQSHCSTKTLVFRRLQFTFPQGNLPHFRRKYLRTKRVSYSSN